MFPAELDIVSAGFKFPAAIPLIVFSEEPLLLMFPGTVLT